MAFLFGKIPFACNVLPKEIALLNKAMHQQTPLRSRYPIRRLLRRDAGGAPCREYETIFLVFPKTAMGIRNNVLGVSKDCHLEYKTMFLGVKHLSSEMVYYVFTFILHLHSFQSNHPRRSAL